MAPCALTELHVLYFIYTYTCITLKEEIVMTTCINLMCLQVQINEVNYNDL